MDTFIDLHSTKDFVCLLVCLMVLNATFNSISVISCLSFLLVEETGGPGENHRPVATCDKSLTFSHNIVHLALIFDMFTNTLFSTCTCINKINADRVDLYIYNMLVLGCLSLRYSFTRVTFLPAKISPARKVIPTYKFSQNLHSSVETE